MWGSLELVQDKVNHTLVPACAPSLPGYMYCGDDRATPWQRMAYIAKLARSILDRRMNRARNGLTGLNGRTCHIDSLADHIIKRILAYLHEMIRPPAHRWITPLPS